jgi:hypothetical protein
MMMTFPVLLLPSRLLPPQQQRRLLQLAELI